MNPLRRIAAVSATVAALSLAPAVTASACDEQDPAASVTASARSATAKYHSLTVAKKAGYSILADTAGITCIAEPGMGAIGVHYVKDDLVNDPAIDAKEPEALVYAPDGHGGLHLAALEYVVIQGDWNAHQIRQQLCQSRPTRALRRRCSSGTSSTSPTRPTGTVSRRSTRCTSGSGRTTLPGPSRCGTPT